MVTHTKRSVLDRVRPRRRGRPHDSRGHESGSLILDILIGMAIFALVAIIAVSAVGQYRMRAYVQAAVSDATSVANAVSAVISDNATNPDAAYPTGSLDAAALAALEVTPTGSGENVSAVVVTPSEVTVNEFRVCVEYRGAYAEYESGIGITGSGVIAEDNFLGCGAAPVGPGGGGGGGGGATPIVVTASAVRGETKATIDWNDVPGATSYSVYLDGSTTATWTGAASTTVLTGMTDGDHSVIVTATTGTTTSDPSNSATFTIVDLVGYPTTLTGYGTDPTMECPKVAGVESRWADTQEQYVFIVTFAETDAQYVSRTGKSNAEQTFRLINADTGNVGNWEGNAFSFTNAPGQKSALRTTGVVEGSKFYIEFSSAKWTDGSRSPKCQTLGKVTLRKTPNWTAGTVTTLDGSAAAPLTARTSTVPCPQISDATYRHNFSYDHIQFRLDNGQEAQYQLWGRSHGPSAVGYNSTFNVNGISPTRPGPNYKTWSTQHGTWAGGQTMRLDLLLKDTSRNSDNNAWSDYCTVALRATKPVGVQNGDTVNDVPVEIISVEPYWGAFGTGV